MSPLGVEIGRGMIHQHLALGASFVNHMLHAIANGANHIPKRLDTCAIGDWSALWNHRERAVRPRIQRFHEAIERTALGRIDCWIAIAREHFAEIHQLGYVKMRNRVPVAESRLLTNNVDRLPIEIEGQHFRECNTRAVDPELTEMP